MTPPNEPREPVPLLPPEYTANAFDEPVIVKPSKHPGWVELVQLRNEAHRGFVRLPRLPKETP